MTAVQAKPAPSKGGASGYDSRVGIFALLVGFMLLSVTRMISDANDITSGGTVGATIVLAMPVGLAALGGMWSERSGIVNIGLEGMMILGTFFGADFAYFSHSPWMGVVGGVVGGVIGGLLHAIATVTFGVDQIISGVAIIILSTGASRYLAGVFFTGQEGGGPTQSPHVPTFKPLKMPGADSLGHLQEHHWFVVSDIGGILNGLATSLTPFTILMLALFPASWFVLWRTAFGLRLRSCGENPNEAEALGVRVYTTKYIAVIVSGALAGLGGAFLVDNAGIFREGQTGGRGFIGLAAMIFGNWRPGGLLAGAGLFGYTDALQARQGSTSVHALLLFIGFALVVAALYLVWRRRVVPAVAAVLGAALFFLWYSVTNDIPLEFVPATPYIITLLVLAFAAQRLRAPAADGIPWRRGQGG
jgi:simple sugar transport system permease protein